MAVLHIENTVTDYAAWKEAFDRYERVRADHGVVSYRVTRGVAEPARIFVDLDFATRGEAEAFTSVLQRIWRTPRSGSVLVAHRAPEVRELMDDRLPG